jgi:hypothetical protein
VEWKQVRKPSKTVKRSPIKEKRAQGWPVEGGRGERHTMHSEDRLPWKEREVQKRNICPKR